jgi:hypothetical protein
VRLRTPGIKGVERRTYISSKDKTAKITLFRDFIKPDGTTESTTANKILEDDNNGPVVFLDTIPDRGTPNEDSVLLVRKDGQILCLNGLDLTTRWTSPAGVIGRNTVTPDIINHKVDFVQLTDVHHASKKLFKNCEDLLSVFPQEIREDGYNPPVLVVITTPDDVTLLADRTLHILTLPVTTRHGTASSSQSIYTLLSVSLPWTHQNAPDQISPAMYSLHITLGVLYELCDCFLTVIDLKASRPKVLSRLYLENSKSFMLLSSTSILAASAESITIYHPAFQSVQASISIKSDFQPDSTKRKRDSEAPTPVSQSCRLVAYSPKQSTAYAIAGNDLLAFRIDSRQDISGQRRTVGLLLDSLGCGVANSPKSHPRLDHVPLASFGSYTAGSDTRYDREMEEMISEMDRYVVAQDVEAFERVMAQQLGVSRNENELRKWQARQIQKKKVNGVSSVNGVHGSIDESNLVENKPIPRWLWPKHKSAYSDVDPRWADYALSRIFSWSKTGKSHQREDEVIESKDDLKIIFYPHNVVNWLIETGNLTPATIQSALRHDSQIFMPKKIYPGQLVTTLSEVDPEFEMLLALLSYTFLDATELLQAIRLLMQSLELFGETPLAEHHMLANGEVPDPIDSELQAKIEIEQEKADRALVIAEHRLEDYSSTRCRALSLALAKLSACPVPAVVSALRSIFSSSEIVSLIYLLRFELARGAWTSRYLDTYYGEEGEDDAGHDNTILLVSGLLNCCVDAIGAGGWLAGNAMLVDGDVHESEELITSLKLEVSAALEGVEEASYLKGLTAEMVRYGEALQAATPSTTKKRRKGQDAQPIILPHVGQEVTILPLGLKAEQQVSLYRIGAGGEIHRRTAREIGQLKSKKVGKYSRERIVI